LATIYDKTDPDSQKPEFVKLIEKQFEILRHWADDKTLFTTFQHTLPIGNIPSKITTKYKADCESLETLLNQIQQHKQQQQSQQSQYSQNIEMLIEFTKHLLIIRQLYNQRSWIELEDYLKTKFPNSLFQSIRQLTTRGSTSAGGGTSVAAFKESIKEVDNCRWLVKYYNTLQSLRDVCNENLTFSLLQYESIDINTPPSSQTYLTNQIFLSSEVKIEAIRQGKAMELHDEPVFSSMLDFCEKSLYLTERCRENKLDDFL
jgi:hypothetical protein